MAEPFSVYQREGKAAFVHAETGERYWIPVENAAKARDAGYVPETEDQVKQYEEQQEYSTTGAKAEALLHGAGSAVTLGAKDVLTELGVFHPGHLRKLREHQPGYTAAGEIGGSVASALTGKLPLGAIGKAVTPMAGKLAAKVAGEAVETGAKALARKAAAAAVRTSIPAAVEGGAMGGGMGVTQVALRDRKQDITAGQIAKHIGTEALKGAGLGGAFGLGFLGLGAAVKGGARGVGKLLTAGQRPSDVALAARRIQARGGAVAETSGADALPSLMQSLDDNMALVRKLKREAKQNPALFDDIAALDVQNAEIRGAIGKIKKSILGKGKPGEVLETVEDVTRYEAAQAGKAAKTAEQQLDEALAKDPRAKPILDQMAKASDDDVGHALNRDMASLKRDEDWVNKAIAEMRSEGRGVMGEGAGLQYGDEWYMQAAQLDEAREIIRDKILYVRKAHKQWRLRTGQKEGTALQEAALVPSSREVKRVIKRKIVDPQAEAKEALGREIVADSSQGMQLSGDVLERVGGLKTAGAVAQFANWRSAGAFAGWAMGGIPGLIVGGVAGSALGRAVILEPALMALGKTTMKAANVAMGLSKRLPNAALSTSVLGVAEATMMKDFAMLPSNEPETVRAELTEAYLNSGMDPAWAKRLAGFKGDMAALLREHAPKNPQDATQRLHYSRITAALSNVPGIGAKLGKMEGVTYEDMTVMRKLYPQEAAALSRAARATLEDPTADIPPSKRKSLEIVAYPDAPQRQAQRITSWRKAYAPGPKHKDSSQTRPIAMQGADQLATTAQRVAQ